jgi:signal transduction histidine kinase
VSQPRLDEPRLRTLLAVGRALVSELEPESVLRTVLDAACELTGARYAAIGVLAGDRSSLERFVTRGIDADTQRQIGDLPRGRGVLGVLIDDPKPLRLADVGVHPRSYGFPIGHPPMQSFLGVPLLIRGEAWGNLYLTEKAQGEFDEADEEVIVALAGWAAIAIENAHLYRGERERRDALERAVRALEATTEIARAVGGETRLGPVLELIVKRGRALVEARGMAILLSDGDDLVVTAVAGRVDNEIVGTRVPLTNSAGGVVMRSHRAERITDATSRLRFALAERTSAQAGLIVPLLFRGRAVGVLEAFDRLSDGPAFSSEDETLMEAFAASAATAVATAQDVATQTLRRSIESSERERARWARDLHDETLQELSALKIALSAGQRAADDEARRAVIRTCIEYCEHATAGLREIISDLRPAALDALGTQAAVETLVERARARSDIEIECTIDLDYESGRAATRHVPVIEAGIYRIAQEAISNAIKHAHASRVILTLSDAGDIVVLTVTDDGRGIDPDARTATGFGLIGMRERVDLLGGTLRVTSNDGAGTRVEVSVPVRRRTADASGEAAPAREAG